MRIVVEILDMFVILDVDMEVMNNFTCRNVRGYLIVYGRGESRFILFMLVVDKYRKIEGERDREGECFIVVIYMIECMYLSYIDFLSISYCLYIFKNGLF